MLRLGIFAAVSEVPYDLAFHGEPLEFGGQNVFFTLLLGVMLLYLLERGGEWPVKAMEVLLFMWIAVILTVVSLIDYLVKNKSVMKENK